MYPGTYLPFELDSMVVDSVLVTSSLHPSPGTCDDGRLAAQWFRILVVMCAVAAGAAAAATISHFMHACMQTPIICRKPHTHRTGVFGRCIEPVLLLVAVVHWGERSLHHVALAVVTGEANYEVWVPCCAGFKPF